MRPTSCIISTYAKTPAGYAQLRHAGKTEYHHRVAYAIHNNLSIADIKDSVIMHTCDNPGCINPAHLTAGTHADNVADRCNKGRTKTGTTKGEAHHLNKLAATDINDIRVSTLSQRTLAKVYGVSQSAIMLIKTFRNWAHIPYQAVSSTTLSEIVQRQKEKLHDPDS